MAEANQQKESQNFEWKRSWRDDYLKWVCGFANAQGGRLVIGVEDDGKFVGLKGARKLLEDLPNKLRDQLGLMPEVNLKQQDGLDCIEIVVRPSHVPISFRGSYYWRSGSVNQELKGAALTDFLLAKSGKTWDCLVEPGATLADIDEEALAKFKSLVARAGRLPDVSSMTTQALLTKLRLVVEGELTRAAVVLFGKDPARYYPNAFVKIGRFVGPAAAMSFQETCEGNLFQLVEQVLAQLETKFLIKPVRFEGLQRIEELEYPVAALREMLLNALVHRDYAGSMVQLRVMDDRISIWNPGELPNGLTVEMLHQEHESIPRNALVADVCYKAGYIDSWGQGVKRMTESCAASGLELPHIEERSGGVYVELRKVRQEDDAASEKRREDVGKASGKRRENVGKTAEQVLALCEANPMMTIAEMAKKIDVSERSIERNISNLQEWNLLRRVGGRKEGRWEVIQNESHP